MYTFIQILLLWIAYGVLIGSFFEDFFTALNMQVLFMSASDIGSGKFVNITGN
jgi:hypothetical protein